MDELIPNEKTYVHDEVRTPGGNGINAAVIAKRLGSPVLATGFLGGSAGEEINKLLLSQKLKSHFVSIAGSTRMNLTVSNKRDHQQTRLSFPGPKISGPERKKLEKFLERVKRDDLVLLGGSLPPGVHSSHLIALIKKLKKKARVLVDIPGSSLKDILKARPDFIKPNLVEFQELTSSKVKTMAEVIPLARQLNLPLVCVSSVEGGALLISPDEVWFGKIPEVKVVSSVGAGDSMVGAILHLLHRNPESTLEELLKLSLAAATATLTEKGMKLGSKKAILKYQSQIKPHRITLE